MAITSGLVLYAVIWFVTLLVMLPIGLRTQGEDGDVTEGTHASAPSNYNPKRKAVQVTIVAFLVWLPIVASILSGWFSWEMIDWTKSISPV